MSAPRTSFWRVVTSHAVFGVTVEDGVIREPSGEPMSSWLGTPWYSYAQRVVSDPESHVELLDAS